MITPSINHQVDRVGPAHQRGDLEGDDGVQAEALRRSRGRLPPTPMMTVITAATRAVAVTSWPLSERLAELVLGTAEDDRVQDKDVRHGEERGDLLRISRP